jgi:hypothetical protein
VKLKLKVTITSCQEFLGCLVFIGAEKLSNGGKPPNYTAVGERQTRKGRAAGGTVRTPHTATGRNDAGDEDERNPTAVTTHVGCRIPSFSEEILPEQTGLSNPPLAP